MEVENESSVCGVHLLVHQESVLVVRCLWVDCRCDGNGHYGLSTEP
jgi:hypothetical protein